MAIQKTKERAVAKVLGVALQTLAGFTVLVGLVFLIIMGVVASKNNGQISGGWRAIYLGVGIGGLLGGIAWSVLSAFTLKTLYTSNDYKKMLGFAIGNAIFIFTFPLTITMIIIAKTECRASK